LIKQSELIYSKIEQVADEFNQHVKNFKITINTNSGKIAAFGIDIADNRSLIDEILIK